MPGALKRAWSRLTSSTEQLESADLRRDAARSGCETLDQCPDRAQVKLKGTITAVTVQPVDGTRWLEATLFDGSGEVSLVWMGRRSIPGIEAGASMRVWGRLGSCSDGRRIFNPRYELLSVPH